MRICDKCGSVETHTYALRVDDSTDNSRPILDAYPDLCELCSNTVMHSIVNALHVNGIKCMWRVLPPGQKLTEPEES